MPTAEVVATLAKDGIEVKAGLVYVVKGKMHKKKPRKAAVSSGNGEGKATGGVKKSQAIRDLLKANPKMKTKAVVETLAGQGIKVLSSQVYFIKGKMKRKMRRQARENAATIATHIDPLATIRKV